MVNLFPAPLHLHYGLHGLREIHSSEQRKMIHHVHFYLFWAFFQQPHAVKMSRSLLHFFSLYVHGFTTCESLQRTPVFVCRTFSIR